MKHLTSGLVVKCQETRSRSQNRKIARRALADKLEDIGKGDQSRSSLKRQAAAKKKASKAKKARRKYRKLDETKNSQSETSTEFDVDHSAESLDETSDKAEVEQESSLR